MKPRTPINLLLAFTLSLAMSLMLSASSKADVDQTTASISNAFTYQGRLTDGAAPANGAYDFQFKLFDAATAGVEIGNAQEKSDVAVVDGFFSVELDFGVNAFTGASRYVEIGVRPGDSTSAYALLTPRRNITPSPYAIYADHASRLSAPDGDPLDGVTVNNNGDVGIGTTSPAQKLHVAGSYLLVDGRGIIGGTADGQNKEMAYVGGEYGDNVQVGSFNPNIQWVEMWNMQTGRMNLAARSLALDEKPIIFRTYHTGGSGDFNTFISTEQYECGIVGFNTGPGDINENNVGDPIMAVYMWEGSNGNWYIHQDFRSHGQALNWSHNVMCVDKRIAVWQ